MTTPPFDGNNEQDPQAQAPQGEAPYGQPQAPQYGDPQAGQPYGQPQAPQYGQPYAQPQYAAAPMPRISPQEERTWASMSHWGPIVLGVVTSGGLAWLAPLIVMLTKGKDSAFVRAHAVESLNFQISMFIYGIVSVILIFVLIGFLTTLALAVFYLVFTIKAALAANEGKPYRYPLTLRLVS